MNGELKNDYLTEHTGEILITPDVTFMGFEDLSSFAKLCIYEDGSMLITDEIELIVPNIKKEFVFELDEKRIVVGNELSDYLISNYPNLFEIKFIEHQALYHSIEFLYDDFSEDDEI